MRPLDMYATAGEAQVARMLVNAALRDGYALSVSDGEEWTVERSRNEAQILDALATTGGDVVRLWTQDGATPDGSNAGMRTLGWFYLVYGNAEDGSELIADYTDNPVCNELWEEVTGEKVAWRVD